MNSVENYDNRDIYCNVRDLLCILKFELGNILDEYCNI